MILSLLRRTKTEDPLRGRVQALESDLSDVSMKLREALGAIKELDADLDWLSGELKRLRGKVTGGKRDVHRQPEPGSGQDAVLVRYTPEWWDAERRRAGIPDWSGFSGAPSSNHGG